MDNGVQSAANRYDATISECRSKYSLGRFSVRLDNIRLPYIPLERQPNVEHLKDTFQNQGCLRTEPRNFISATIESQAWHVASNYRHGTAPAKGAPAELLLGIHETIDCTHGKCRIEAAKTILRGLDRWWTVELSVREQDDSLLRYTRASYSNEGPPSDAALYIGIQQCRYTRDIPGENRCWAYLKPNKRKHLKQFLSQHVAIAASFNKCLSWPPLWHPTRIGVFHKIVASRCYEEVIAYIDDICLFFNTVSEAGKLKITDTDVQALQGRCPYLSESDRQYLQKSMDEEQFLGHLDHDSKAQFFSETAKYPKTVPSFYTFFEDFKYIMLCSEVLKYILSARELPKGSTLRTCFYDIYQFSRQIVTQTGATEFVRAPSESHRDAFLWSYQQLWLCSMRLWPYLLPQKPRKDKKMEDGRFQIKIDTVIYWAQIAETSESLGFKSDRIRQLATIERSLNNADGQRYDDFVAGDTVSSFRIESRCGIPFGCTTDLDRNSLFINRLLMPHIHPAKDITAFFVRRVLLQRLFPEATELYASCSRAYRTAVSQTSLGASREPRSVAADMRSGSSSTRHRRSRSPRTGQVLGRERTAFETYYLTIYEASDKVKRLVLSLEERRLRARQLQSQGYRLLTENVNHIEESSLPYFVERTLLAVNERNVDLNLFRSKMGLVVSGPGAEMDIDE